MRKLNGKELLLVLCIHCFYQGQEALQNNKFWVFQQNEALVSLHEVTINISNIGNCEQLNVN